MQSFSHHAAMARVQRLDGGVSEITYSGPMSCDSFVQLNDLALDATAGAACLVLRLDRALSAMHCVPTERGQAGSANCAPAALIVREDQFEMWNAYARRMAGQGIMRAVFLDSFAAHAYRWAQASARAVCPAVSQ